VEARWRPEGGQIEVRRPGGGQWRPGGGQVEIQRPGGQVEATNRYLAYEPHLGRVICAAGGRFFVVVKYMSKGSHQFIVTTVLSDGNKQTNICCSNKQINTHNGGGVRGGMGSSSLWKLLTRSGL
jgi:hypothetical protein